MIKGNTPSGFAFEIEDTQLDNYELLDAIAEVETNPIAITRVVNMLLGAEQKKRLLDHVRDKDGRVSIEAMSQEITGIFSNAKPGKNS